MVTIMGKKRTTVQKWGNSLAIRIPSEMATHINMMQGAEVEIIENGSVITIEPIKVMPEYTLEELLQGCTPEKRHDVVELGIYGEELI